MQYMKHLVFNLYSEHYTVMYKIYYRRLTIIMYVLLLFILHIDCIFILIFLDSFGVEG